MMVSSGLAGAHVQPWSSNKIFVYVVLSAVAHRKAKRYEVEASLLGSIVKKKDPSREAAQDDKREAMMLGYGTPGL
jgi:hypothetical protein